MITPLRLEKMFEKHGVKHVRLIVEEHKCPGIAIGEKGAWKRVPCGNKHSLTWTWFRTGWICEECKKLADMTAKMADQNNQAGVSILTHSECN